MCLNVVVSPYPKLRAALSSRHILVVISSEDAHAGVPELYSKRRVEHQECADEIDLVPRPSLDYPPLRVLKWVRNVMDVHENPRCERRQDIKIQVIDIAARFVDVA